MRTNTNFKVQNLSYNMTEEKQMTVKIKATKVGLPKNKFTFKVTRYPDGVSDTVYVLRRNDEKTRVFHTVKKGSKIIHHHEENS